MAVAPANATPAMPARRPSKRMRAVRSPPPNCVAAYVLAIAATLVRLPAAATPIRSRRLRCALATASRGRRSKARPRMKAGTSANPTAVSRSRSAIGRFALDESVGLEEAFGDFLRSFFVDVDAGVQLG